MQNAQAAVVDCCGSPFRVTSVHVREPRQGELLVRVVAAGVCHTDIAVRNQEIPTPVPVVLGHEGVGVVEKSGSEWYEVGDYVLMTYTSCEQCENCAVGKPYYCRTHRNNFATSERGYTEVESGQLVHSHFFGQSSHATYCLCTDRNVIKIDKQLVSQEMPLKSLAPLACGVNTGCGVVLNALKCPAGSSIVVFGTGAVGMSCIMAARVSGCTMIVGVDLHDDRLQLAKELGATHVINSRGVSSDDLINQLASMSGKGGMDFSVDSTGVPEVLRIAFECLRPTGQCVLVGGSKPGSKVQLPMDKILLGRTLRGCIQGESVARSFIPRLIELHRQKRLPFDRLITYYEGGLKDLNTAAADSMAGKAIKPVIVLSEP